MANQKRRDARHLIRFPAQLSHSRQTQSLLTQDVSLNGVFLRTDSPPPLLQLVRVRLILPIGGRALEAHGMTVHVVPTSDQGGGASPGVGIQFYALDPDTRTTWDGFIRHVEGRYPPSPDQVPLRLARGMTPESMRRRFERHTAVLKVSPETQAALEELYNREISVGTIEIDTPLDLASGTRVVVHVVHPVLAVPFLMEGTVLYAKGTRRPTSVTIELGGMQHGLREEFLDFVGGGIVIGEERVVEGDDGA
jgi:hypothetical protein